MPRPPSTKSILRNLKNQSRIKETKARIADNFVLPNTSNVQGFARKDRKGERIGDQYVLFSDNGNITGESGLSFNKTTNALTVFGPINALGNLTITGASNLSGKVTAFGNQTIFGNLNVGNASSAVATGDLSAGDGTRTMFWDASAGRLGVGTGTPSGVLHATASTRQPSLIINGTRFYDSGTGSTGTCLLNYYDATSNKQLMICDADNTLSTNIPGLRLALGGTAVVMKADTPSGLNAKTLVIGNELNVQEGSGVVVNEGGADRDFRVEGDTDQNLFRSDANNDRIGIGIAAPSAKLHVAGDVIIDDWLNIGTTTLAVAQGDFSSGTTNNIFYDDSAGTFWVKGHTSARIMSGPLATSSSYHGIAIGGVTSITTANYQLLSEGIHTYLNVPSGGTMYFREANTTRASMATGGAWSFLNYVNVGTTTSAMAQGDFSAGTTGARELFWDDSKSKLEILGNDSAGTDVPKIELRTDLDTYPQMQIAGYTHDNAFIAFDSYFDTTWKSSDAGSNFVMSKNLDKLTILRGSGNAQGASVSWTNAFSISSTGITTANTLMRVGTSTLASSTGDFCAGITGSGQMMFDETYGALNLYNSSGTLTHSIASDLETAFNYAGADIDFRIEGNTDVNLFFCDAGNDNVGMGTNTPNTSAKLDISSTTGALLVPRMTTTQRNALTATNGMIIYNTTTNQMEGYINSAWASM